MILIASAAQSQLRLEFSSMSNFFSSSETGNDGWKSDARYAMESGTFCVVCGAPFDIEGDIYHLDPKEPRYQWLSKFRLLGKTKDLNVHKLTTEATEPINTSESNGIFLSEKAEYRTAGFCAFRVPSETGIDDILYNPLCYSHEAENALFPLHEACIEISCRVIDNVRSHHNDMNNEPTLAALYNFLNTRYIENHTKGSPHDDSANDIFNLSHYSKTHGPRSVLAMTRLEWWGEEYDRFYAEPTNVAEIEVFVFDMLSASSKHQPANDPTPAPTQKTLGIEQLPNELLTLICNLLPPQSVIKLHRSSKTLSRKIRLDNIFWRDQLRTGSLHPHIWALDTQGIETLRRDSKIECSAADGDWKTVARLLAMKQFTVAGCDTGLCNMPPGLWNRCRIWSIVEGAFEYEYFGGLTRERLGVAIE